MLSIIAAIALFLLLSGILGGCLNQDEEEHGAVVIFSMEELVADNIQRVDNVTKKIVTDFTSLNVGDTLHITDSITNLNYDSEYGTTIVQFGSNDGNGLSIEGDVTDRFQTGDTVTITLHIIRVMFLRQDPNSEVIWTFDIETFKE